MNLLELHFEKIIENRAMTEDKMIKISRDKSNMENPMDRENLEESVKVEQIKSLAGVYQDITSNIHQNFHSLRVPVVEEAPPTELCFDLLGRLQNRISNGGGAIYQTSIISFLNGSSRNTLRISTLPRCNMDLTTLFYHFHCFDLAQSPL